MTSEEFVKLQPRDLGNFFKLYKDKNSILFDMYPNGKVWKSRDGSWRYYPNIDEKQKYGGNPHVFRDGRFIPISNEELEDYFGKITPTLFTTTRTIVIPK